MMVDNEGELSARPVDISELLSDPHKQYITPDFQRDFDWTEEQFDELLSDIRTAIERDSPHFLGQVIIVEQEKDNLTRVRLIDGQQRVTTIVILVCALRDAYKQLDRGENKFEHELETINRILYCLTSDGKKVPRVRLENNEESNAILENVIKEKVDDLSGAIGNCYDFYETRFSGLSAEQINSVRQAVLQQLRVIRTSTGSLNSAYQVFQTQNDRGLPLSVIDLAKSITFEAAATDGSVDSEKIKNKWLQITSCLDQVSGPGAKRPLTHILGISDYQCSMSAYPSTFIKKYKEIIRSELDQRGETVADFIDFLDREAATYYQAAAPAEGINRSDLGPRYDTRAKQFRYKNPHAGVALYYVYKTYKDNEPVLYKILDVLTILNVRLNLSDATQAAKRDPIYKSVAGMLDANNPAEAVKSVIKTDAPSDPALEELLKTRNFKLNNITRLVLKRLEGDHFSGEAPETDEFQIEHIAPRRAFSDDKYTPWRSNFDHDDDQFDQFCDRIGNLTLLNGSTNANIGANPFTEKKSVYKTSKYSMTRELGEYDRWSYSQIQNRSNKLSELIVKSWSIE